MSAAAARRPAAELACRARMGRPSAPGPRSWPPPWAATSPRRPRPWRRAASTSADGTLRQLAGWLVDHTDVAGVADISRDDIEDFKVWLARRPGTKAADPG